ncbi:hypothetical protein Nepgr_009904 [Nepenthes gracilis]|uniref:Uncharacterized protein n=1 Tax=Nepenthes gracilis TaxID=150966 RepID=A0AAD3SC50_NEPGR|nr:hypothetical protein Nepgr_009904 [Nepenthes gracilis]
MEATAEAETKLIEIRAMEASGLGFDLTFDFRLKFAKGVGRETFVVLDEANKKVVVIPGGVSVHGIFSAIRASKCGLSPIFGDSTR